LKIRKKRIAAFGFRSIPPSAGAAGADKFVYELLPRLVKKGFTVTAYNRNYPNQNLRSTNFQGVNIVNITTINKSGFDTLIHSFKSALHILLYNTADIVHIQNGGNSIWAALLRLFGKKVFISQDGLDWKRDKWPWYAKIYLKLSIWITAHIPDLVICDNIFVKKYFQDFFPKQTNRFDFIPFGSEVEGFNETNVLSSYDLIRNKYLLFIGRFIPDKGLQYLIPAYKKSEGLGYKLVLVGGSPNRSEFETQILKNKSENIIMPGYLYGDDVNTLIKNAYLYIQPSDVEGLSPVILQVMGIGTPLLCSDIKENLYIVKNGAVTFIKSNTCDLFKKLSYCIENPNIISELSQVSKQRIIKEYNWDSITDQHINIFTGQ
jgi:glycosyltransferase involved in cell wall biosynthesis